MGATIAKPPKKAKEEPKKAGTFPFVKKWKSNVPSPAISRAVETSNPVIRGTSTVAPNMAKVCCKPKITILGIPSFLAS